MIISQLQAVHSAALGGRCDSETAVIKYLFTVWEERTIRVSPVTFCVEYFPTGTSTNKTAGLNVYGKVDL